VTGVDGRLRVAVLGPGGVGGLLAALLARDGHEVTCLAPPATAAHLAARGIELRSAAYGHVRAPVRAASELAAGEAMDAVLVAVKATQLEASVAAVPPGRLGDALLVPFLNGVEHPAWLRGRYPAWQVVPAAIRVESTRVAPGVIEHTSPFAVVELAVGGPADGRTRSLAAALAATGLEVMLRDDEATMLWAKLGFLGPAALLTTAVARPIGDARERHRDDLLALIHEVAEVARAEGVELDETFTITLMDAVPPRTETSMQRDAAAGRPIEIEAIGGAVLRAAARRGVPVPVTTRYVEELRGRQHDQPAQPAGREAGRAR
jgi:2-dehydropantoate 2-reductase